MKSSRSRIANKIAQSQKLKGGKPKTSKYASKLEAEQKRLKGK